MRFATLSTISVTLMVAAVAPARGDTPEPLPTRWMAPPGVERPLHDVWEPAGPFGVQELPPLGSQAREQQGRIDIAVEYALYTSIQSSILQYQTDLAERGYTSLVSLITGGTPENLRTYLTGLYNEPAGLIGAVLVGDLPYIVYEMMQDWDGTGGDPPEYEDFPCDLSFMDMDGTWTDDGAGGTVTPGNGKYDGWSDANPRLEIWVGRMQVETLSPMGTPADLLNNYFSKNHAYRSGALLPENLPARALVYVDDDWGNGVLGLYGDAWCVKQVYGDDNIVTVFDDGSSPGNNATALDYKTNHMTEDYQLAMLRSHGYPGGHGFYKDYRTVFGWVYNSDYRSIDPEALFYSFFVCSGCDYTAQYGSYQTYLGGVAAFNEYYGLVSWGSAKTGGMWNDYVFYTVLAEPNTIGAAFVEWFNESYVFYSEYAPRWWYGMVLIGDPALIPNGDYATAVADREETPAAPFLENRPNPFNPATEISFALERDGAVTLAVYDVSGRCVRTLFRREMTSGVHSVIWDGTDEGGVAVGSGVYLCRLSREGSPVSSRKMLLLK